MTPKAGSCHGKPDPGIFLCFRFPSAGGGRASACDGRRHRDRSGRRGRLDRRFNDLRCRRGLSRRRKGRDDCCRLHFGTNVFESHRIRRRSRASDAQPPGPAVHVAVTYLAPRRTHWGIGPLTTIECEVSPVATGCAVALTPAVVWVATTDAVNAANGRAQPAALTDNGKAGPTQQIGARYPRLVELDAPRFGYILVADDDTRPVRPIGTRETLPKGRNDDDSQRDRHEPRHRSPASPSTSSTFR